jgi:DNA-binding PadR family transcriptional regulator
MLEKGWIKALPGEDDSRRKEYQITELGKFVVRTELTRLEELVRNGNTILNNQ